METPKLLISGSYSAFNESWNGAGVYMCSGLYQSETYKIPAYVGSAADLQDRIEDEHIAALERNKHPHNAPLQYSWNKHSEKEGFVWWLLELYNDESLLELKDVEQKYLDLYRPFVDECGGFNIQKIAKGGMRGVKHSLETKRRMREAKKGRKVPFPEEFRRMGALSNIGRKRTDEAKRRMSESQAKLFSFLNPAGELVEGVNLRAFCIANGLNGAHMHGVLKGRRKSHKGWRVAISR